jgi:hypothetical protein
MLASRGMGAINPSKMPKGTTAKRKDGDKFTKYAKGGAIAEFQSGGKTKVDPRVAAAKAAEEKLRNYNDELMFMDRSEIPPPEVQEQQKRALYEQMINAAPLGFVPGQLPGRNFGFPTPKEWQGVEQLRKAGGVLKKPQKAST